jgi:DNA-binding NarL/FixJ family response regulator
MSETTRPIRVLIADDHPLIRASLRATLEDAPGIQVVGEAENGAEVQQLIAERSPHVLVLYLLKK